MSNPIVYLIPHQDDEVLTFGAAIMEDVFLGREVICYLGTNGNASGVRTGQALFDLLGYTPTQQEFSEARDREFTDCCALLGATPVIRRYNERESDGAATVSGYIHGMKVTFPPGLDIAGTTSFDYGNDHNNIGHAVNALVRSGWARSGKLYIAHNRQNLNLTGIPLIQRGDTTPVTIDEQEPYRRIDIPNGFWNIGYLSVASSFDSQLTDGTSYFHHVNPMVNTSPRASDGRVITLRGS